MSAAPAGRSDTGLYTVPHLVGHGNYSVQITPRTGGKLFYVTEKENYLFYVQFTGITGSAAGVISQFDYTIVGENT